MSPIVSSRAQWHVHPSTEPLRRVITYTTRHVAISVAETGSSALPEHIFRHGRCVAPAEPTATPRRIGRGTLTHSRTRTTCSDSEMDGGRAIPFMPGISCRRAGTRPFDTQQCTTQRRVVRPHRRHLVYMEAQQSRGIELGRENPDLPWATWGIQDEQDGNSRGRVRTAPSLACTLVRSPFPALPYLAN